jgi:formylglycine-generating enzyme required for sulfatase activity
MQGADNRIIILDACYDNPFQYPEIERGLTPIKKIPEGTLIAYAAKPGQVVAENNPYTKNLISEIQKPDLSITEVFLQVKAIVREKTGGQQESEYYSELKVDFYFAGNSDSWLTMVTDSLFWVVILLIGGFLKILYALIKRKKVFKFDVITVNARGEEIKRTRQQAQYYTENLGNGVSLEMVSLPGGTFLMGSPETEEGNETVKPFYMGKYTVTQAQWKIIMGDNPSEFVGDNRPVENVTYEMAEAFCQRLSKMTGKTYRLPSEAEWEYACRAGTTTPFHFGETMTTKLANYDGDYTYALEPKGIDRQKTTEVGRFPPNAFGLYDMHGNVWEWTEGLVQRGGSWSNPPTVARSAYRLSEPSNKPKNNVGFRLVSI